MALAAAGCARETVGTVPGSSEFTFTVNAPAAATRAISDGLSAANLTFAVYDAQGNYLQALSETATVSTSGSPWTVTVPVVQQLTYRFVFIATATGSPYSIDLGAKTVTATYGSANDDAADFFYATLTETIGTELSKAVALSRPLAQVNVGAADLAAAAYSLDVANMTTGLQLTGIANVLNILDGTVSGAADITLAEAARVNESAAFVTGYDRIAMGYVLVGDKQTSDATITVTATGTADGDDHAITREVANIPLQANYRTNILGNIFTSNMNFTVTVTPGFAGTNDVVPTTVSNIAGLNQELIDNSADATDQNYEVSTVDAGIITIPTGTQATSLTFNLDSFDSSVTALTIVDQDTSNGFTNDIVVEVPEGLDFSTLTINTPSAHVTLKQGTYTTVIASTSGSTLVVDAGTEITNLTVNSGSVEINGTVGTITNNTGATLYVKGTADYTPAAADNIIYIKEGTTGNVVLDDAYSVYPETLDNALAAGLDYLNGNAITVKLAAGTYENNLVFSGNGSPWNGKHGNKTVTVVGATGNAADVVLDGQVFTSTTTVKFKDLILTNENAKGLNYYKTAYSSNGGGFQSQKCVIMTWTTGAVELENVTLINAVSDATTIYTYWGTGIMNVKVKGCTFKTAEGTYQRHFQVYGNTNLTVEDSSFDGIYRYVACIHGGDNVVVWKNNTVTGLNPSKTCYAIEYGTSTSSYWDAETDAPDKITVEGGTYPFGSTFIPYYKVANGYRNEPTLSGTMPDGTAAEWGKVYLADGVSVLADGSIYVTKPASLAAAVSQAADGATIVLADGVYNSAANLIITKNLTIKAENDKQAQIDGKVIIASDKTIRLEDLLLQNDNVAPSTSNQYYNKTSTAIVGSYDGSIEADNCLIKSTTHYAALYLYGANSANDHLYVTNCVFDGTLAYADDPSEGFRPLMCQGNLKVENSTFIKLDRYVCQMYGTSAFSSTITVTGNKVDNPTSPDNYSVANMLSVGSGANLDNVTIDVHGNMDLAGNAKTFTYACKKLSLIGSNITYVEGCDAIEWKTQDELKGQ